MWWRRWFGPAAAVTLMAAAATAGCATRVSEPALQPFTCGQRVPPLNTDDRQSPIRVRLIGASPVSPSAASVGVSFRIEEVHRGQVWLVNSGIQPVAGLLVNGMVIAYSRPEPGPWAADLIGYRLDQGPDRLTVKIDQFCSGAGRLGPEAGRAPTVVVLALMNPNWTRGTGRGDSTHLLVLSRPAD